MPPHAAHMPTASMDRHVFAFGPGQIKLQCEESHHVFYRPRPGPLLWTATTQLINFASSDYPTASGSRLNRQSIDATDSNCDAMREFTKANSLTLRVHSIFTAALLLGGGGGPSSTVPLLQRVSAQPPGGGGGGNGNGLQGDNILGGTNKDKNKGGPPQFDNQKKAELRRGQLKKNLFKECPDLASELVELARTLANLQPPRLNRRGKPTRRWKRRNDRAKRGRFGLNPAYCVLGCDNQLDRERYDRPLGDATFPDCSEFADRAKFCTLLAGKASEATMQLNRFVQKKNSGVPVRPNKLEKLRREKEDYAAFAGRAQCPEMPDPN